MSEVKSTYKFRAMSVDPSSKFKSMLQSNSTTDLDSAADQFIEGNMNQYMTEISIEDKIKQRIREEQDRLDTLYDDIGGKVFDFNQDLNL